MQNKHPLVLIAHFELRQTPNKAGEICCATWDIC